MTVAVIGLGSMGRRRIRLLRQINNNIQIIGIDLDSKRQSDAEHEYKVKAYTDFQSAQNECPDISAAFVCTAPASHGKIIRECLEAHLNVFSELNLVDDLYDENIELAGKNNLVLFMSSTFLYRDEIKYIRDKVEKNGSRVNYCYHVGQYLPDWHPWESYKAFFVGNKRTSGCREIMAIEFPWLINIFGNVKSIMASADKISSLDVDYFDTYHIIVEHESGIRGSLSIDVVSRKPVRNLEVFGENIYLSWDGSPTGLSEYDTVRKENVNIQLYKDIDHQKGYSAFVVENAYKNEIAAFFKQIEENVKPAYTFSDDKVTLSLIDSIEHQVCKYEV